MPELTDVSADAMKRQSPEVVKRGVELLKYLEELERAGVDIKSKYELTHPFSQKNELQPTNSIAEVDFRRTR